MSHTTIMAQIKEEIKAQGFQGFGITPLKPALSLNRYRQWLEKSYHGDMSYLKDHLPIKQDPRKLVPGARSAIVISRSYFPLLPGHTEFPFPANQVALYAQGRDYHHWFQSQLQSLANTLAERFKDQVFFPATDSAPLLERDLAYRAGLGWVGKNTCLIDRQQGSLFFIGEILTSLPTEVTPQVSADHCGSCTRCIEACPTQALHQDREMDARRCISYWTIESRELPPEDLRSQFKGWLFGCDICQTVCPWNQKVFGSKDFSSKDFSSKDFGSKDFGLQLKERVSSTGPNPHLISELRFILGSSNRQLKKILAPTPLSRTGGRGLKRNAMIVVANHHLTELIPEVKSYLDHPKLGELARWCLLSLGVHT